MRPVGTALFVYGLAVVAVLGLQLAAVTVLAAWRGGSVDLEHDGLTSLFLGVPASSLALIVIAFVAGGRPAGRTLRLRASHITGGTLAVMIVGTLALSQALESLSILFGSGPGPALDWLARTMATASPAGLLLAVLIVGILAPVGEELFFRGYMQTRLRRAWSAGPSVLLTALAFGVIHGELVHGVLAFGIGIYLGILTERTGSVVPSVICHAVNNSASVLLSAWVGSPTGVGLNAAIVVATAAIVAGALRWIARTTPAPAA